VLNGYEFLNERLLQLPYSSIVHAPGARISIQGNLLCGYRPRHVYAAKIEIRHGGSWRIFDATESAYRYQFAGHLQMCQRNCDFKLSSASEARVIVFCEIRNSSAQVVQTPRTGVVPIQPIKRSVRCGSRLR